MISMPSLERQSKEEEMEKVVEVFEKDYTLMLNELFSLQFDRMHDVVTKYFNHHLLTLYIVI